MVDGGVRNLFRKAWIAVAVFRRLCISDRVSLSCFFESIARFRTHPIDADPMVQIQ